MTMIDDRCAPPRFPPVTLGQLQRGKCDNGHQLPRDPDRLLRHEGHVYCLGCESSNLRPPGATECINGHDITQPGSLEPGTSRCLHCKRARQREYAARQRRKPTPPAPAVPTPNGTPAKGTKSHPSYYGIDLPPLVVRMNAACSPDTAHLFERRRAREKLKDVQSRHRIAATICERCPVFRQCAKWYRDEPPDTDMVAAVRIDPAWIPA